MSTLAAVVLAIFLSGSYVVTSYEDGAVTYQNGRTACLHPDQGCTP